MPTSRRQRAGAVTMKVLSLQVPVVVLISAIASLQVTFGFSPWSLPTRASSRRTNDDFSDAADDDTNITRTIAFNLVEELATNRRAALARMWIIGTTTTAFASLGSPTSSVAATTTTTAWTGTRLSRLTLAEAAATVSDDDVGVLPMARWPDPVLRVPSVPFDPTRDDPRDLRRVARALSRTRRAAAAAGLAAQQCGVGTSLVVLSLSDDDDDVALLDPRVVARSPETRSRVWEERCLVLPPSFRATVVRDAEVTVEAEDATDPRLRTITLRLRGEPARALQHECDHDRGVLITDHVGLEDLGYNDEDDGGPRYDMRRVEAEGHEERQSRAYERYLGPTVYATTTTTATGPSITVATASNDATGKQKAVTVPENERKRTSACNEDCRRRLSERRALARQSRSDVDRQTLLELSRQRAALYNTTYRGVDCVPGLPCW